MKASFQRVGRLSNRHLKILMLTTGLVALYGMIQVNNRIDATLTNGGKESSLPAPLSPKVGVTVDDGSVPSPVIGEPVPGPITRPVPADVDRSVPLRYPPIVPLPPVPIPAGNDGGGDASEGGVSTRQAAQPQGGKDVANVPVLDVEAALQAAARTPASSGKENGGGGDGDGDGEASRKGEAGRQLAEELIERPSERGEVVVVVEDNDEEKNAEKRVASEDVVRAAVAEALAAFVQQQKEQEQQDALEEEARRHLARQMVAEESLASARRQEQQQEQEEEEERKRQMEAAAPSARGGAGTGAGMGGQRGGGSGMEGRGAAFVRGAPETGSDPHSPLALLLDNEEGLIREAANVADLHVTGAGGLNIEGGGRRGRGQGGRQGEGGGAGGVRGEAASRAEDVEEFFTFEKPFPREVDLLEAPSTETGPFGDPQYRRTAKDEDLEPLPLFTMLWDAMRTGTIDQAKDMSHKSQTLAEAENKYAADQWSVLRERLSPSVSVLVIASPGLARAAAEAAPERTVVNIIDPLLHATAYHTGLGNLITCVVPSSRLPAALSDLAADARVFFGTVIVGDLPPLVQRLLPHEFEEMLGKISLLGVRTYFPSLYKASGPSKDFFNYWHGSVEDVVSRAMTLVDVDYDLVTLQVKGGPGTYREEERKLFEVTIVKGSRSVDPHLCSYLFGAVPRPLVPPLQEAASGVVPGCHLSFSYNFLPAGDFFSVRASNWTRELRHFQTPSEMFEEAWQFEYSRLDGIVATLEERLEQLKVTLSDATGQSDDRVVFELKDSMQQVSDDLGAAQEALKAVLALEPPPTPPLTAAEAHHLDLLYGKLNTAPRVCGAGAVGLSLVLMEGATAIRVDPAAVSRVPLAPLINMGLSDRDAVFQFTSALALRPYDELSEYGAQLRAAVESEAAVESLGYFKGEALAYATSPFIDASGFSRQGGDSFSDVSLKNGNGGDLSRTAPDVYLTSGGSLTFSPFFEVAPCLLMPMGLSIVAGGDMKVAYETLANAVAGGGEESGDGVKVGTEERGGLWGPGRLRSRPTLQEPQQQQQQQQEQQQRPHDDQPEYRSPRLVDTQVPAQSGADLGRASGAGSPPAAAPADPDAQKYADIIARIKARAGPDLAAFEAGQRVLLSSRSSRAPLEAEQAQDGGDGSGREGPGSGRHLLAFAATAATPALKTPVNVKEDAFASSWALVQSELEISLAMDDVTQIHAQNEASEFTLLTFGGAAALVGVKTGRSYPSATVAAVIPPFQADRIRSTRSLVHGLHLRNVLVFGSDLAPSTLMRLSGTADMVRFAVFGREVWGAALPLTSLMPHYLGSLLSLARTSFLDLPLPSELRAAASLFGETQTFYKGLVADGLTAAGVRAYSLTVLAGDDGHFVLRVDIHASRRRMASLDNGPASILVCSTSDLGEFEVFVEAPLPPLGSSSILGGRGRGGRPLGGGGRQGEGSGGEGQGGEAASVTRSSLPYAGSSLSLAFLLDLGLEPNLRASLFSSYLTLPLHADMHPSNLLFRLALPQSCLRSLCAGHANGGRGGGGGVEDGLPLTNAFGEGSEGWGAPQRRASPQGGAQKGGQRQGAFDFDEGGDDNGDGEGACGLSAREPSLFYFGWGGFPQPLTSGSAGVRKRGGRSVSVCEREGWASGGLSDDGRLSSKADTDALIAVLLPQLAPEAPRNYRSLPHFSFMELGSKEGNVSMAIAELYPHSSIVSVAESDEYKERHLAAVSGDGLLSNNIICTRSPGPALVHSLFESPEFMRFSLLREHLFLTLVKGAGSPSELGGMLGELMSSSMTTFLQLPSAAALSLAFTTFYPPVVPLASLPSAPPLTAAEAYLLSSHPLPAFRSAETLLVAEVAHAATKNSSVDAIVLSPTSSEAIGLELLREAREHAKFAAFSPEPPSSRDFRGESPPRGATGNGDGDGGSGAGRGEAVFVRLEGGDQEARLPPPPLPPIFVDGVDINSLSPRELELKRQDIQKALEALKARADSRPLTLNNGEVQGNNNNNNNNNNHFNIINNNNNDNNNKDNSNPFFDLKYNGNENGKAFGEKAADLPSPKGGLSIVVGGGDDERLAANGGGGGGMGAEGPQRRLLSSRSDGGGGDDASRPVTVPPWNLLRVDVRNLTTTVHHHFDYQLDGHTRTYTMHVETNATTWNVFMTRETDGFRIPWANIESVTIIALLRLGLVDDIAEEFYDRFLRLPLYEDMAPWNIVFRAGELEYIDYDTRDVQFDGMVPRAYQIMAMLMNYERTVKDFGKCSRGGRNDYGFPFISSCVGTDRKGSCHESRAPVTCGDGTCTATYVDCLRHLNDLEAEREAVAEELREARLRPARGDGPGAIPGGSGALRAENSVAGWMFGANGQFR